MNFKHIKHNLWRSDCNQYLIRGISEMHRLSYQATYCKTVVAVASKKTDAEEACRAHAAALALPKKVVA